MPQFLAPQEATGRNPPLRRPVAGVGRQLLGALLVASMGLASAKATALTVAERWGQIDLLEVCCSSDSGLAAEVEATGGRASRMSHWCGYDLSTKHGSDKALSWIRTNRPRWTWFSPPCDQQCARQRINDARFGHDPEYAARRQKKKQRSDRINANVKKLYLACVREGLSTPVLEQPTSCESWRRTFKNFKEQFGSAETHGCSWGMRCESDKLLIKKPWTLVSPSTEFLARIGGHRCTQDHDHHVIDGAVSARTAYYPQRMVKFVVKHMMRPITYDDYKNCIMAVSSGAAFPASGAEEVAADPPPLTEKERAEIHKVIADLHRELDHPNNTVLVDMLKLRNADPRVIREAKDYSCQACDEERPLPWYPIVNYTIYEPGRVISADNFYWKHPLQEVVCRGTLVLDHGSRHFIVKIHQAVRGNSKRQLGNTSAEEMKLVLSEWCKYYGRPEVLRLDPEGAHRSTELREWGGRRAISIEPEPAEAHWRMGAVERHIQTAKSTASRTARRVPLAVSCTDLFDSVAEAHGDLRRSMGL